MSDQGYTKARYIMLGGFLGAGKTTAVAKLGRYLINRGLRVGLISNDQSSGLVDTTLLRSQGFDVEEIAGGCFCCRFTSLVEAANKLEEATKPDVFIAEPVGSCTDLIATVSYPLRRIYGEQFSIAPLSVLVDPLRCARILGLAEGRSFSSKVCYVYKKQLEEAEIIVVNKCDLVAEPLQSKLLDSLRECYSNARVITCSAKTGEGLNDWFDHIISGEPASGPTMEVDYETYAEGEALLGWLNCTVKLVGEQLFDANAMLVEIADEIRNKLSSHDVEIAHLKMTLDAGDKAGNLSVVSLVGSDDAVDLRESLHDRISGGELIINLRAEVEPELLGEVTKQTLDICVRAGHHVSTDIVHLEQFRPGKPEPTHRMTVTS